MENTVVNVNKRVEELITEDGKDYVFGLTVSKLNIKVNTSKNKVTCIIFDTANKSLLKNGYALLKISNKVSARKIYTNLGTTDDIAGNYHLLPRTKYVITIKAFPQFCLADIQEVFPAEKLITTGPVEYSSSSSSSSS